MSSTKEQVSEFLKKCEDLKSCKFIMATKKIKDLLKCIVNCPEIYRLFEAVTHSFNYPEMKKACLVTENAGMFEKNYVVLPQTVGHRLAFIFCLLVEFDENTINFNEFLCKYYPEDGSFVAGYRMFCDTVIVGLQEAVIQVFKDRLNEPDGAEETEAVPEANPQKAKYISALETAIAEELYYLSNSNLSDADKEVGSNILAQLYLAIRDENKELIHALISGYNYFALYFGSVSEGLRALIETLTEFEKII